MQPYETAIPMVAESEIPAFKIGRVKKARKRGRPPLSLDIILEAYFFRLRNSGPWRDVDRFGPWRTIYGWHVVFDRLGLWTKALRKVARPAGISRFIDGTHIRVHQAGANPAGGGASQAMGKTKGGRNTKLMLMTDLSGRPVALLLVCGQAYEGHHVVALIEQARLKGGLTIVGDKAYDDDKLRFNIEELGLKHCFPRQSRRKGKRSMNKTQYRKRYRVENCFCRLKRWASVATRRDKLASRFLTLVTFAAVMDWLA
jgi:transposase